MTVPDVPDAAVQIVEDEHYDTDDERGHAQRVAAALARAGWLTPPDRLAELEAVAEAAREHMEWQENHQRQDALAAALAALDTVPAPTGQAPGADLRAAARALAVAVADLKIPAGHPALAAAVEVRIALDVVPAPVSGGQGRRRNESQT